MPIAARIDRSLARHVAQYAPMPNPITKARGRAMSSPRRSATRPSFRQAKGSPAAARASGNVQLAFLSVFIKNETTEEARI